MKKVFLIFLVATSAHVHAQSFDVNSTYGLKSIQDQTNTFGYSDNRSILANSDGSFWITSNFHNPNDTKSSICLTKISPTGSVYGQSFVTASSNYKKAFPIPIAKNNSNYLIVGNRKSNLGVDFFNITDLNVEKDYCDGTKITAIQDIELFATAVQNDNKIILVGSALINNYWQAAIIRLNSDLTLDMTFNGVGIKTIDKGSGYCTARAVTIDNSNNIVLAGHYDVAGIKKAFVLRLTSSGVWDNSFNAGSSEFDFNFKQNGTPLTDKSEIYAIATDASNNIFVGGKGSISTLNGGKNIACYAKISNVAALIGINHSIFNTEGMITSIKPYNGDFLLGGFNTYNTSQGLLLMRMKALDGTADVNFHFKNNSAENFYWLGAGTNNQSIIDMNVNSDGTILLIGEMNNTNFYTLLNEINTGTQIISQSSNFNIYPNPATDFININNKENTKISIFDIEGRKIESLNITPHQNINIQKLINGIYFIKDESNNTTSKFIKQ